MSSVHGALSDLSTNQLYTSPMATKSLKRNTQDQFSFSQFDVKTSSNKPACAFTYKLILIHVPTEAKCELPNHSTVRPSVKISRLLWPDTALIQQGQAMNMAGTQILQITNGVSNRIQHNTLPIVKYHIIIPWPKVDGSTHQESHSYIS